MCLLRQRALHLFGGSHLIDNQVHDFLIASLSVSVGLSHFVREFSMKPNSICVFWTPPGCA